MYETLGHWKNINLEYIIEVDILKEISFKMNTTPSSENLPSENSDYLPQYQELDTNGLATNIEFGPQNTEFPLLNVRGNETFRLGNVVRVLLLGNSGCGKSSFIRFMSRNRINLSGTAPTSCVKVQTVNHLFDMVEAPGFQSATTEADWNGLVSRVNACGGVDIFLILLHPSEEYAVTVFKELNIFERKYVDNQQLFWDRAVVAFTNIDTMKSSRMDHEKNIQILLHDLNVDKLREIVIYAENRCIYVDCLNVDSVYQTIQLQALYNQIIKIQEPYPEDILLQSLPSMNDTNPMTTFGDSISHFIEDMNCELDGMQFVHKKKKRMKIVRNLDRLKHMARSRKNSVDTHHAEEMSVDGNKTKSRRKSSLGFVMNPLKRIIKQHQSSAPEYVRINSDRSIHPAALGDLECEVTDTLNRSLSLPCLASPESEKDKFVKENLYAIQIYQQNKGSKLITENVVVPTNSDGSNGEEKFYTPAQSPSELN